MATRCGLRDFFDSFEKLHDEEITVDKSKKVTDHPTFRVMSIENEDDYKKISDEDIFDAFFDMYTALESGYFISESETLELASKIEANVQSTAKSSYQKRRVL